MSHDEKLPYFDKLPSSLRFAGIKRRDKKSIRLRYRYAGTRKAEKSFRCQTSDFRWKMGDHYWLTQAQEEIANLKTGRIQMVDNV